MFGQDSRANKEDIGDPVRTVIALPICDLRRLQVNDTPHDQTQRAGWGYDEEVRFSKDRGEG
jgi:hypothetical protein